MTITTNGWSMTGLDRCRVSITGTPGCGKSSLAQYAISQKSKYELLEVIQLAEEYGCIGEIDEIDDARPIDIEKLAEKLGDKWNEKPSGTTFVDGHLSHLLPVDAIVILRCNPEILTARNRERGWLESKILENSEWELLGGSWNESHEWGDLPCLELNSTEQSVGALFEEMGCWIRDGFKPKGPEEQIDWVSVLHE